MSKKVFVPKTFKFSTVADGAVVEGETPVGYYLDVRCQTCEATTTLAVVRQGKVCMRRPGVCPGCGALLMADNELRKAIEGEIKRQLQPVEVVEEPPEPESEEADEEAVPGAEPL